jgi:alpha-tubulin suppressor-like RCC1 family protein
VIKPLSSFLALALTLPALGAGAAPRVAVDLDAGPYHSCFVDSCGDVHCFGANDYGQAASPSHGRPWTKVTTGSFHTCALDGDGQVRCWGYAANGRTAVPTSHGPFVDLDAGADFTCAINTAGAPVCWGAGSPARPPAGLHVTAIGAGVGHACAVLTSGLVRCWGYDNGGAAHGGAPVLPDFVDERFVSVSAGAMHTCALTNFGIGYCWGSDIYGAVTDHGYFYDPEGDGVYAYNPRRFRAVAAGTWGTCAHYHDDNDGQSTADDEIWCWGWPFSFGGSYAPPAYAPRQLAIGTSHACAIDPAGVVDCWGSDARGKASPPTLSATCGFSIIGPIGPISLP